MSAPLSESERELYNRLREIFSRRYGRAANIHAYLAIREIRRAGVDPQLIDPHEIDPEEPWDSFNKLLCRLVVRDLTAESRKLGLTEDDISLMVELAPIDEIYDRMLKHTDKKAVRRALLALSCLKRMKIDKWSERGR